MHEGTTGRGWLGIRIRWKARGEPSGSEAKFGEACDAPWSAPPRSLLGAGSNRGGAGWRREGTGRHTPPKPGPGVEGPGTPSAGFWRDCRAARAGEAIGAVSDVEVDALQMFTCHIPSSELKFLLTQMIGVGPVLIYGPGRSRGCSSEGVVRAYVCVCVCSRGAPTIL